MSSRHSLDKRRVQRPFSYLFLGCSVGLVYYIAYSLEWEYGYYFLLGALVGIFLMFVSFVVGGYLDRRLEKEEEVKEGE